MSQIDPILNHHVFDIVTSLVGPQYVHARASLAGPHKDSVHPRGTAYRAPQGSARQGLRRKPMPDIGQIFLLLEKASKALDPARRVRGTGYHVPGSETRCY